MDSQVLSLRALQIEAGTLPIRGRCLSRSHPRMAGSDSEVRGAAWRLADSSPWAGAAAQHGRSAEARAISPQKGVSDSGQKGAQDPEAVFGEWLEGLASCAAQTRRKQPPLRRGARTLRPGVAGRPQAHRADENVQFGSTKKSSYSSIS